MVVDEEENEFGSHEVKCEQNDHLFIVLVAKYRRAEGAIKYTYGRKTRVESGYLLSSTKKVQTFLASMYVRK